MSKQPAAGADRLVEPQIVDKPWGREVWYAHETRYAGKILEVARGQHLALPKREPDLERIEL